MNPPFFDIDEQNFIMNKISYQLDHLYVLIENNLQITKQSVKNALELIQDVISEIDKKINILIKKKIAHCSNAKRSN